HVQRRGGAGLRAGDGSEWSVWNGRFRERRRSRCEAPHRCRSSDAGRHRIQNRDYADARDDARVVHLREEHWRDAMADAALKEKPADAAEERELTDGFNLIIDALKLN